MEDMPKQSTERSGQAVFTKLRFGKTKTERVRIVFKVKYIGTVELLRLQPMRTSGDSIKEKK